MTWDEFNADFDLVSCGIFLGCVAFALLYIRRRLRK